MRTYRMLLAPAGAGLALTLASCQPQPTATPVSGPPQASTQPVTATTTAPTTRPDPMIAINTLIDAPPDFARRRIGTPGFIIPPYAAFLKNVKVCIDPGHGGDAHVRRYKRGPTGVREAEMNLRVSLYLRDLLEHVGAKVMLTRTTDVDSSLAERAEAANRWGADLFISCHHNAVGNPAVNRTSVWYHGTVDHRPSNLDLARNLCRGLMQELNLPQISAEPLNSDQLMYAGGFGVLRAADVTAALCEISFYTNREEEQRLRLPEYNLREAYGLFLGLAWYAYNGLPRLQPTLPPDGRVEPGVTKSLTFKLDDGLRSRGAWGNERQMILTSSLDVRLDGKPLTFSFTNEGYVLTADLPAALSPGGHRVDVQFVNLFKNSVLNPTVWIDVPGPVGEVRTMEIPPDAPQDSYLRSKLIEIDRKLCRDLGLAVEQRACGLLDLNRGRLAMIRPDSIFYGASVPKITTLLTYFERHPDAATNLDPEVRRELGLMIKRSDNAMAAKYSQQLGLDAIRNVLTSDKYRFYDARHGGGLWNGKHYSKDSPSRPDPVGRHSHAATVRQCLRYYLMLEQGRLVSPDACRTMKEIFASPALDHLQSYFVKGLRGRNATILRKSGTWEPWYLDTAIIELDGARYILVAMTEHKRGPEYLEGLARETAAIMAPRPAASAPVLQSLFDGKSLDGWNVLSESAFKNAGKVSIADGAIVLETGRLQTGIAWAGEFPADNYEVSLDAKRIAGHDFFCGMTFPVGEERATLIVGGWGGSVVGLSNVDGRHAAENETTLHREFDNDRWYRIRLRVTPERIEAWIDDDNAIGLLRAGHHFDVWYEQMPVKPFGVATWDTGAALRNIVLRRLSP